MNDDAIIHNVKYGDVVIVTDIGHAYYNKIGIVKTFLNTNEIVISFGPTNEKELNVTQVDRAPLPSYTDDVSPYHTKAFVKGEFGETSKIFEEIEEFKDAISQDNPILELCELSDIIGAIAGYTEKKYNINLDQLIRMTEANKRAFESGYRK